MHGKALIIIAGLVAAISPATAADITISDPWIRGLPAGLPSGGYFVLHNNGHAAVTLAGARSAACGMLMLHRSEDKGGMARMEGLSTVAIPAGGSVRFTPGGYHLMCMDPAPTLKPGSKVIVTLLFVKGPPQDFTFAVRSATGKP